MSARDRPEAAMRGRPRRTDWHNKPKRIRLPLHVGREAWAYVDPDGRITVYYVDGQGRTADLVSIPPGLVCRAAKEGR